ncbi:serine protease [Taibaiella sp. KBW10]|uniref:S46 family peptidase n=1 Tax=Taibaiella sp. KBW10 TaxID=2153357 RepID=UPI000F5B27BC|nr:S46 family peptidase [Taibaiella sp. KBW10]RQO31795.1 serine protease [Taibaiella sp. KBW10]
MRNRLLPLSLFSTLLFSTTIYNSQAKEGMWRPADLKKQADEMKKAGLQIPVSKLYEDGKAALNDAVVIFGGGCTGEVVSAQGLVFTNHHCGYGAVQGVSTDAKNYLINGFWAKNNADEVPCPGLSVTFIKKIEEVTKQILKGITEETSEAERAQIIAENIKFLETGYRKLLGYTAEVKPFYNGNEYWVTLLEKYDDVRLVGFPPNGIGKFGGDTDNWMWPRQTGDFGIFRVYAGPGNKPAAYNINNKPYKAEQYFPINTSGVKEGDYTMVYGFPYVTKEYLTSAQLAQTQDIIDPIRIAARKIKLGVWDEAMRKDPKTFLKYASKQSSVSNGYKKWQGEIRGLELNDVKGKKLAYETRLMQKSLSDTGINSPKSTLSQINAAVEHNNNYLRAYESTNETVLGIEIIGQAAYLQRVLNIYRSGVKDKALTDTLAKVKKGLEGFYKNYDAVLDKQLFENLMPFYYMQPGLAVAPKVKSLYTENGSDFGKWSSNVYGQSALAIKEMAMHYFDAPKASDTVDIKNDPAYQIYHAVIDWQDQSVRPGMIAYAKRTDLLNRIYMQQQLQYMSGERNFYPDANQTLRLTYGHVKGITPQGTSLYSYRSTLEDVIAKHNPDVEEFNVPSKLRDLYLRKDYGRWNVNGTVPVTFIATNHTSGGNSGSPVLNAKGELIGINFDRIWDGTMSDLYYDPNLCRNIAVDVRYVLFIIEKYGNAPWLFKEMNLVK